MTYQNDAETPLTIQDWRQDAADLAFSSALIDDTGEKVCIDQLVTLLANHPSAIFADAVTVVLPLIEAKAYASAALCLMEPHASYLVSGPVDGRRMATVVLRNSSEEHHAEGATAAIALVGSFAAALAGEYSARKHGSALESQTFRIN